MGFKLTAMTRKGTAKWRARRDPHYGDRDSDYESSEERDQIRRYTDAVQNSNGGFDIDYFPDPGVLYYGFYPVYLNTDC